MGKLFGLLALLLLLAGSLSVNWNGTQVCVGTTYEANVLGVHQSGSQGGCRVL